MPSIEIKNWITGLVVGILGLALASLGTVLAYKQLKRTKRPDDVENGDAEIIVMRDVAVVTEEAGSPCAAGASPVKTRDGVQSEMEAAAVGDGSPETPLPATDEGAAKWIARKNGSRAEWVTMTCEASTW